MLASTLLCVLALSMSVMGDWPEAFGTGWLSWRWQTCVVVGDWLYIDGGEYYYSDGGDTSVGYFDGTLSVDLSQSWAIDNVSPLYTTKPSGMTLARRPFMWYDPKANTVFSGGGWEYDSSDTYSLWYFQPDGQGSASWTISTGNAQEYTPTFASAFVSSNTAFYSLGGASVNLFSDANLVNTTVDGLAEFGFDTDSWNTQSSAGASQSSNSVFAEAVFMPNFGEEGLLAFVGGESPPNSTYEYEVGAALVDMSNITVYDPTTQTWYHQTATGDIPPPRTEFCAAGNAPTDNATFEIYIYGGSTNATTDTASPSDTGYTDVYVLSFPSFTWFKTNVDTEIRRASHYCQVIGNSQMLVVGGRDSGVDDGDGGFGGAQDPWKHGLDIFDMVNWAWTSEYNHTAVYTRPQAIQQHYDTSSDTQFSDPALKTLFVAKPPSTTTAPGSSATSGASSSTTSSASSGTTTAASSGSKSSNTGAIAGGVVGGVALLAGILGIVLFCSARKRKQRRAGAAADHAGPMYTDVPHADATLMHPIVSNGAYKAYKNPVYEMLQESQEKLHELEDPPKEAATRPVELSAEERPLRR